MVWATHAVLEPVYFKSQVQLIEYETDPYFPQLSQNMATDCLFTFVFSPVNAFNLPVLRQKLYCFDVQNNFRPKIQVMLWLNS